MNRFIILLFPLFLISCCNEPKILKNGLTQKANKITEYTINIKTNSLNKLIQDTIVITEKKYNNFNQIISRKQRNSISDGEINIQFIYNENRTIKKEIVKLSVDSLSFNLNYFYKDTLLFESKSEFKNNSFKVKYIKKYKYNSENILNHSSSLKQNIDLESNDTITNTIEIKEFDNKVILIKSKLSDFRKPGGTITSKYEYNCGMLKEIKEFNNKDSLISKTEYKYEFDKFKNWTKRESFENEKLEYITRRKIEYK